MPSIYVGSLPAQATEEDLQSHFDQIGHVGSVRIMRDADSGASKGFGFCEFDNDQDVQQAIDQLDGQEFMGRRIRVSRAKQ